MGHKARAFEGNPGAYVLCLVLLEPRALERASPASGLSPIPIYRDRPADMLNGVLAAMGSASHVNPHRLVLHYFVYCTGSPDVLDVWPPIVTVIAALPTAIPAGTTALIW